MGKVLGVYVDFTWNPISNGRNYKNRTEAFHI